MDDENTTTANESDIVAELQALGQKVDTLQASIDGMGKNTDLTEFLNGKLSGMDSKLTTIAESQESSTPGEYGQALTDIQQLGVYTNMLLLVLVVVLVIIAGAVFGHEVVSRFRVH